MTQAKQQSFLDDSPQKQGKVECLGMTFDNDEARRAYFTEKLREKLQDPEFRKIEGFPIGEDEDILALSDPPYYTACPNPFIEDFIKHYGKPFDPNEPYHREPFATDVSEGKNDPIYNAHSYHTKVPHKAIMRYILHYTEPGDVVLDGFCGTGMTGIAAQLCGNQQAVQELGYSVQPDGTILDKQSQPISRLGTRRAILNDLSPIAVFIAGRYNTAVDFYKLDEDKKHVEVLKEELNWVYECTFKGKTLQIAYVVWSDAVWCDSCGKQVNTYDAAIDKSLGKILNSYPCPNCGAIINKSRSKKVMSSDYDLFLGRVHSLETRVPKLINAIQKNSRKRREIPWREVDEEVLKSSERITPGSRLPILEIPYMHMTHERNTLPAQGITHTHHFYTNTP